MRTKKIGNFLINQLADKDREEQDHYAHLRWADYETVAAEGNDYKMPAFGGVST